MFEKFLVVYFNYTVFNLTNKHNKALKDRLELVLAELKKNGEAATNSDLLETINLITVTLNGIKGGEG